MSSLDVAKTKEMTLAATRKPTAAERRKVCAPLTKLSAQDKIAGLRHLIKPYASKTYSGGPNDWAASMFAQYAIGGREQLPWTGADLEHLLTIATKETQLLPEPFVARAVEHYAAVQPLDAKLRRLVAAFVDELDPDGTGDVEAPCRDAAAKLRAVLGEKAAPKKAKAKKEKTPPVEKAKAPRKPGGGFAQHVRAAMARELPDYPHREAKDGSGSIVSFDAPANASRPRLHRQIFFQKLSGGDRFRVNFDAHFDGESANGPTQYVVLDTRVLDHVDTKWSSTEELDEQLGAACRRLDKAKAKFFGPIEQRYAELDRLFGGLVAHYAAWFERVGRDLPADQWKDSDDEAQLPAFDSFVSDLSRRGLLGKGKSIDLQTPLWHFWGSGRPMRQSEYDKSDYYYCVRPGCGSFIRPSRGRLEKRKVASFGDHYALVCNKH